jgi:hypothetical protein
MVGPCISTAQPVIIPPRVHEIDQGKQVAQNDIKDDGCHNPFVPAIMNFEISANFPFAVHIDPYDGMTDPQDHVEIFQQTMVFQGAKEPMTCQAFPLKPEGCRLKMVLIVTSGIHLGMEDSQG